MKNTINYLNDLERLNISIRDMMFFVAVAETGSVTKASQQLFVTQPYLSKLIQNLENKMSVTLFNRTERKLELTEAGKHFLKDARNILQTVNDVLDKVEEIDGKEKQELNIGISYDLDPVKLLKDIPEISSFLENAKVSCSNFYEMLMNMELGSLDCVIVFKNYVYNYKNCESVDLLNVNTHAIVSKSHPFALEKEIYSKDLANERICFYIENSIENRLLQNYLNNYCQEMNIRLEDAFIADSYITGLFKIYQDKFVLIGNKYSLLPNHEEIVSIPCIDQFQTLSLVYRKDISKRKKQKVLDFIHSLGA